VKDAGVEYTYILRPSMITGNRKEHRGGEKMAIALFKMFNWITPKKYRAVEAKAIAQRMISLCKERGPSRTLESNEI